VKFSILLLLATLGADEHMLAGARFFRAGKFAEALVEFRVAEKLGGAEAAWYAGAALQKLGRPEEAVETFAGADPAGHDPLLDYYRALACYDARLYLCADRLLLSVGDTVGPRIAAMVRETRAKIAEALKPAPTDAAIDWYRQHASEAAQQGRQRLAAAYQQEARELAARRPK
jgi:hypothetical protein